MYNIIPLIFILVSLSVIIVIITRKFPALSNLEVGEIPAEKEARFKELIISNKLKRIYLKWRSRAIAAFAPARGAILFFFKFIIGKLNELKENYKKEIIILKGGVEQKIAKLFIEAEQLKGKGDMEGAEKNLISIIGLDSKNIKAFKELGGVYFENKNYKDAWQTLEHALKLAGDDSEIFFELALVNEASLNLGEGLNYIEKALSIEPNNPRYLDTKLEISIIKKDKIKAEEAFGRLKEVNPENQKLEEFRKQIDEI